MFEYEADDAPRALTALLAAYHEDPAQADWHELSRVAEQRRRLGRRRPPSSPPCRRCRPRCASSWRRKLERWADVVRAPRRASPPRAATTRRAARARPPSSSPASSTTAPAPSRATRRSSPSSRATSPSCARSTCSTRPRGARSSTSRTSSGRPTPPAIATSAPRSIAASRSCGKTSAAAPPAPSSAGRRSSPSSRTPRTRCARSSAATAPDAASRRSIEALRRRADLASLPMRAEIYCEIGSIHEHELADQEKAIEAHLLAEQASPAHEPSLIALARLFDETGAWHSAVDRLVKRAKLLADAADALPLYLRAGELCAGAPRRPGAGRDAASRASLEIDATHVPALTALATLHKRAGAPAARRQAARRRRRAHGEPPRAHAVPRRRRRALRERRRRGQGDRALPARRSSSIPSTSSPAARVADLLWRSGRWADLVPVLEMLTRKDAESPSCSSSAWLRLARAARSAEQPDKAARAWARAADLAPASLEAQRGHADTLLAAADWAGALQSLERIFQYHVDDLDAADRATLFGDLALLRGQARRPRERPRVRGARARGRSGLSPGAAAAGRAVRRGSADARRRQARAPGRPRRVDEQVRLLDEIGDLYLKRLYDPARAVGAWAEALELAPDDHRLLHKVARRLRRGSRLAAGARHARAAHRRREDRRRCAPSITTPPASSCATSSRTPREAAAHLRAALDDDPKLDRAARALEEVDKALGAWNELGAPLPPALEDARPRVARRRRRQEPRAAAHLERARRALPAHARRAASRPSPPRGGAVVRPRQPRAAEAARRPVPRGGPRRRRQGHRARTSSSCAARRAASPPTARCARSTRTSASATRRSPARTRCTSSRRATPTTRAPWPRSRSARSAPRAASLDEQTWARLVHPEEDRLIDCLFALVGPTIAAGHAQTAQARRPQPQGRARAARIGARSPRRSSTWPPRSTWPCPRPTSGPSSASRSSSSTPSTGASSCRCSSSARRSSAIAAASRSRCSSSRARARCSAPERLLRLATPHPQQIGHVLDAAMALVLRRRGRAADAGGRAAAHRRGPQARAAADAARAGHRHRQEAARERHAHRRGGGAWLQAADLTSIRAGYALVGDLETCARLVAADGRPTGCARADGAAARPHLVERDRRDVRWCDGTSGFM